MNILALDPGTTQTGWAVVGSDMKILGHGIFGNGQLLDVLVGGCISFHHGVSFPYKVDKLACEMMQGQGMPVGKEVFETLVWIGRFVQAWHDPEKVIMVFRKSVKIHLCGTNRANDSNVRQAIIDLYEPTGGGTTPQIGTKGQPGPLFGVSSHVWPAIGVGIVAHHQCGKLVLPDTLPLYATNGAEAPAPF